MPLQQAQLGQLPYMNLARYVPERPPIEPAWHKALTAFLVNTAAGAGRDIVSNAMAPDYSKQAAALGLPGADGTDPSFASRVLHGPSWDRQALQEGVREKNAETRAVAADKMEAERLGLSRDELKALNDYRAKELADREKEMGQRDEEARRTDEYRKGQTAVENRRIDADISRNQDLIGLERDRLHQEVDPNNPLVSSTVGLRNAETQHYNLENDPTWQGRVKAQQMLETLKAVNPDMYNKLTAGSAPTGSNDNVNFHATPGQSVPGGQPVQGPTAVPVPTATTPPTTQSISPDQVIQAREAANRATAAGTSSQMGQSQQMTPIPPTMGHDESPDGLTQPQAMVQHVGEAFGPSDLLSLVRPEQTPNSPTSIHPSTAAQTVFPTTLDPQTMRMAAEYARRMLMASQGGLAMQAGNGGIPAGSV